MTALRSLLSFLHARGVVAKPLASAVPTVASWRLAGLPIGLTPAQVQALLNASRYLEHGRPSSASGRAVFIRAKAPYQALNHKSISTIVGRAAGRAELGTVHAHLLRHTLATDVLSKGASLDEVGQLLRHRSRASTAIYAKVDQRRLIELARPWPTSGGLQ